MRRGWLLVAALLFVHADAPAARRATLWTSLERTRDLAVEASVRFAEWWRQGRWQREPDALERWDWTRAMRGRAIHPMACVTDGSPASVTMRLFEVACFGMRRWTARIDVSPTRGRIAIIPQLDPAGPPQVATVSPETATALLRRIVAAVAAPEARPLYYSCTTQTRVRVAWSCGDSATSAVELVDDECDETRRAARLLAVAPR